MNLRQLTCKVIKYGRILLENYFVKIHWYEGVFFFLDSPQFSRVQNTENRVSRSFFGPHATPRPETLATQASEDVGVMSKRLNRLN